MRGTSDEQEENRQGNRAQSRRQRRQQQQANDINDDNDVRNEKNMGESPADLNQPREGLGTEDRDEFALHAFEITEFQDGLLDCECGEPWYDIAGSQYEGREYSLSECDDGDLVILQKEPDNPYDRHAVRLYALDSYPESYGDLGFIPSDQNYDFYISPSPIALGRIRHTKGEENYCRGWKRKRWTKHLERDVCLLRNPDAPTICPLPIPEDLIDTCRNLVQHLDEKEHKEWVALKTKLLEDEEHQCVFSGLRCDSIEPIFTFLQRKKTVRLEGFTLVHNCLRHLLYIDHAQSSEKSNMDMISYRIYRVNPEITIEEAERIYKRMIRTSKDRKGWKIDVGDFSFATFVL